MIRVNCVNMFYDLKKATVFGYVRITNHHSFSFVNLGF